MSHTQHTPGPWVVCIEDDSDAAVTIFAASQLRDGRIAADEWDDCIAIAGLNHNESEANAHLIAAAPELYEALSYFVDDISDRFDIDAPSTNPGIRQCIVMGRAALAKARGES